ncbi:TetR/AcrR family transcriptional regulator [Bordetella hinzii]|uniref:TetR/AcrR family transcriptional regulator n=2 Tax=Bordetella hinzii TaxID=103855 RepID=A0AAN1RZ73_9BORD|nr:TetR/AcrR family transcriptional regulator [Bordetella hinzii]AKQ55678.1 HTH-type transcriptional regulator EthR [Bordetella hinzii]AKQ60181.1 HTH-type transcriptional regulator EthR [Bordetella hinzii]AZW18739.1 TetR/AcrR family transcriptional regulator [Bordetella hinzii]MBZ0081563.1 TetR/AcrR family transcriptional regulator [Bordetella hinzii]MBZ0085838.1 TetR/AcrR family transcriptional regulator [Bordetella hinzii]
MTITSKPELEQEPARGRTKGEHTRIAIKEAARDVMARDGFAAMRIADIMSGAGKSPGAFYIYFKNKEELLHELLEDFRHTLKNEVNRPLSGQEDPLHNLAERLQVFWRIYRRHWPVATAAFQMSMQDDSFARAWHHIREQGIKGLVTVIRESRKQQPAPDKDLELVASALSSMIEYACYNWTAKVGDFPGREIDDETAIDVLTRLALGALHPHPAVQAYLPR